MKRKFNDFRFFLFILFAKKLYFIILIEKCFWHGETAIFWNKIPVYIS